ncbi:MAG: hypothetical protein HYZ65_11375 [Burkholderiales bacterium]|nr:hypothetical protein [Burkholderiales bacterium]
MASLHSITGLLLLLGALCLPAGAGAIEAVTVLMSEEGGAYAEFAYHLSRLLGQASGSKTSVRLLPLQGLKNENLARSGQLVVAVGTAAMQAMANKPPAMPVLNVMISSAAYARSTRSAARALEGPHFSAIYFDQSWARQFNLIRYALPGRQRIGVLLGKETAELAGALKAAAREAELSLNIESVADEAELLPALKRLLANSDALLAVPDSVIYNRNNIPSILLTSYRAQVPLFGFSASYVKAGALAAVYSQPVQISQQVAEIILNLPASGHLPPAQPPRYFSVSVNPQVQHSLALSMDGEAELLRKLRQSSERAP